MKRCFNADKGKVIISYSVREFLFLLKNQGKLTGYTPASILMEGKDTHRLLQKQAESAQYQKDVPVKVALSLSGYILLLSGVADGITTQQDTFLLDEFKTVSLSVSELTQPVSKDHYYQALLYTFAWMQTRNYSSGSFRLVYYHAHTQDKKEFLYEFTSDSIQREVSELVALFAPYGDALAKGEIIKRQMCNHLRFPYQHLRSGQKDMMHEIYSSIRRKGTVFFNAPTGIGKTMAALYPALKALGKNRCDRVFYLTSKGSVEKAVFSALQDIWGNQPFVRTLFLTAKEKICPNHMTCRDNPCSYQVNYYRRIHQARRELLENHVLYHRKRIGQTANTYEVCPFALSLDMLEYCDLIICDYNYFFDTTALLLPFAQKCDNAVVLIDEAHNLPKRVSGNYSGKLTSADLVQIQEAVFLIGKGQEEAYAALCEGYIKLQNTYAQEDRIQPQDFHEFTDECGNLLDGLLPAFNQWLYLKQPGYEILQNTKEAMDRFASFLKVASTYDHTSVAYFDDDLILSILCLDPSRRIREVTDRCGTTVFFSATLLPQVYFERMFALKEDDLFLSIPSPFNSNHLLILHWPLPQTYRLRSENLDALLYGLKTVHTCTKGNVLVFFPSYEYLHAVVKKYPSFSGQSRILVQNRHMSYDERNDFLHALQTNQANPYLAFAVMGGIFSESIDLVGDSLCGVVIVGSGMPPPSPEGGRIAAYFNEQDENGIGFAYHYPTLNRIIQAAGRVIRSETDRGFLLLCDERFGDEFYQECLPEYWNELKLVLTADEIQEKLNDFL
jgi:Rad3-related DNA helicase